MCQVKIHLRVTLGLSSYLLIVARIKGIYQSKGGLNSACLQALPRKLKPDTGFMTAEA